GAGLEAGAGGHRRLPEFRNRRKDLGLPFFAANVGDAVRGLEALPAAARHPPKELMALRDRLLERLCPLVAETPGRAAVLKDDGGPDTLLHGDLWRANVFVTAAWEDVHVRLIEWDHLGAAPFHSDRPTFPMRFPPT